MVHNWEDTYEAILFLSRKWVLPILAELAHNPKGHNELARAIGAEHRPLGRALDRLESAGLVEREVDAMRKPVRVRYRLTPRGRAVQEPLNDLAHWWNGT